MKDMFAVLATIMLIALVACAHANDKPSARQHALANIARAEMTIDYLTVASSVEEDELKPYVAVHVVNGDTIRIQVGVPMDAVPLDAPKTAMLETK